MKYPSELELLNFFGVDPIADGDVLRYTLSGEPGLTLTVSLNMADDSLQTTLSIAGNPVAVVCHEGLSQLRIVDGAMLGEFFHETYRIVLNIELQPHMRLEWSGLRV